MKKIVQYERSVFIPDLQVPFLDEEAFACAVAFVKYFKPDVMFQMGDAIDLYSLSKYDKDPARALDLQKDLDATHAALRKLRQAAPQAKFYLIKGNHEYRLTKYLWSKAGELSGLSGLKMPELLRLKELNCRYVESGSMLFHGFVVKHGNVVRTRSGYSATGELEKVGVSGISGHTHRLAQVYKTHFGGMYTWVECGCLCRTDKVEYLEGQQADWQHGLAAGFFERGGNRFTLHVYPIIKGKMIYDGREIYG